MIVHRPGGRITIGAPIEIKTIRSAGGPWSPTNIAGCKLWLDFSDADTLFTDAGSTKVTANDDLIYQVNDKSESGKHFTQSISVKRPLYKVGVKNSLSVAYFDGSGDFLYQGSFSVSQPDTIIVAVCHHQGENIYLYDGDIGNRQLGEIQTGSGPNNRKFHQFAGSSQYSDEVLADNTYNIFTAIFNGASSTITIGNGSPKSTNVGTQNLGGTYIGSRYTGSNYFLGYYLEVIVYDSALSDNDRAAVFTYLNKKWGIY
jgi:hypothetical protein